jgi:hypothetical protein
MSGFLMTLKIVGFWLESSLHYGIKYNTKTDLM